MDNNLIDNFTDAEKNTINTMNFVIFFILVLMVGVLIVYHSFIKSSTHLNKIMWPLAILYMILIIVNGILYASYRNRKDDPKAKDESRYIPLMGIIGGAVITGLVMYGTNESIKKFNGVVKAVAGTASKTAGKYFTTDSTTTVVGETTSPMKLTNTY
uniref:Uncharacterized protein n=1 Tax=viral metagenome TaxID=1070528 RepID=A0A6C0HXH3_9ZZZZ